MKTIDNTYASVSFPTEKWFTSVHHVFHVIKHRYHFPVIFQFYSFLRWETKGMHPQRSDPSIVSKFHESVISKPRKRNCRHEAGDRYYLCRRYTKCSRKSAFAIRNCTELVTRCAVTKYMWSEGVWERNQPFTNAEIRNEIKFKSNSSGFVFLSASSANNLINHWDTNARKDNQLNK